MSDETKKTITNAYLQRYKEMNMSKPVTETTKIELENMVDHYGLVAVLEALAEIAGEKAEHINVNWQDGNLAKNWQRVGSKLWSAAGTAETYIGR